MRKLPWFVAAGCVVWACFASYGYYVKNQESQRLSISNLIVDGENRLLRKEINDLEHKPTYEDGCRDTIIKMGGPQSPSAYMDGWNAAILTLDTKSYADGYHTAIQQFGYQKPTTNSRWLVEEPTAK